MVTKFRRGMFETNSSSAHVFIATKDDLQLSVNVAKIFREHIVNGVYCLTKNIDDDEVEELYFGRWPFKILMSPHEKLQYACAAYGDEVASALLEIIQSLCPECTAIRFPEETHHEAYLVSTHEQVSARDIEYTHDCNGYPNCYRTEHGLEPVELVERQEKYYGEIDHQSENILDKGLQDTSITIKEFILDPHYIMIIDGDEYDTWGDLKDNKIIDRNTIKYECDLSDVTETYTDNTTEGSTDGKDN